MSAIDGPGDGPFETIQVLIVLFPGFSREDFTELENIFSSAQRTVNKSAKLDCKDTRYARSS